MGWDGKILTVYQIWWLFVENFISISYWRKFDSIEIKLTCHLVSFVSMRQIKVTIIKEKGNKKCSKVELKETFYNKFFKNGKICVHEYEFFKLKV